MNLPVYMDNNSTTRLDPEVFEAMKPCFLEKYGNAASKDHSMGWEAEAAVEYSRKQIAQLINSEPSEIIFTSGATESINLAHFGIAEVYFTKGKRIITSAIEHSAVLDSLRNLEKKGFEVIYLDVNKDGFIDLNYLKNIVDDNTLLVSIMTANNEIGIINNIEEIGNICKKKNVFLHTDATQAIGKIPFNVKSLKADFVSFSAHKFYGPKGIGVLYINKEKRVKILPRQFGGGHEKGLRSGTLNVPAIVGMGKAAEICGLVMCDESARITKFRNILYNGIVNNIDDVYINGSMDNRLPNNLNFSFLYTKAENIILNMSDIAVSTGAACTSASLKPSHVLKALGLPDEAIKSSIRLSPGRFTTNEEIEYVVKRIVETVNKVRSYSPEYNLNHNNSLI
jgi:cysteine desulfurase